MINFYTLNSEKLGLTVIDFRREYNTANEIYIQITLTVSATFFNRIETEALFNYHTLIRNNETYTFENKKPVVLKIRLRNYFVKMLNEATYYEAQILNAMENEEVDFSFLNQTESWLLYTATQEQDLPAELEGTGTLKLGISTKFNDNKIINTIDNRSPIQIAKAYLHQQNLLVEIINNNTLKTIVQVQDEDLDVVIFNNEKQGSIIVYSMFPEYIAEAHRTDVANMLIKINYQLGVGAFEMDTDDGELRFRTAICYINGVINDTLFKNMFTTNTETIGIFLKDIQTKNNQ